MYIMQINIHVAKFDGRSLLELYFFSEVYFEIENVPVFFEMSL